MAAAVEMSVRTDIGDGTLGALQRAIALRRDELAETTADAVVATAQHVLRSLKAATKSAARGNVKVSPAAYDVSLTGWVAKLQADKGGARHYVVCVGHERHARKVDGVRPAVRISTSNLKMANVYSIRLTNPSAVFAKSVSGHPHGYYLIAADRSVAVKYAEERVLTMMRREGSMARYAISIARAKLAAAENFERPVSSRAASVASDASIIRVNKTGWRNGAIEIKFLDDLNYSANAAKISVELAMQKAVNSTVGIVNAHLEKMGLDRKYEAPFPEASIKKVK